VKTPSDEIYNKSIHIYIIVFIAVTIRLQLRLQYSERNTDNKKILSTLKQVQ